MVCEISTIVRPDKDNFMSYELTSKGDDLNSVWEEHKVLVQQNAIDLFGKSGDKAIGWNVEEIHPLEKVFANVRKSFKDAEAMVSEELEDIDEVFGECLKTSTEKQRWVRVAIGWTATRLSKAGTYPHLEAVLAAAIEQATKGKGQRHGGDKTPFLEQPWVRLYKTHGLGFLLGQADKKYHEAIGKENQEDAVREFLGAIVYLGMALLVLEGRVK